MRVLITGAAGFIGSHVADRLVQDGHEVVGIDNLSTGRVDNFPAGHPLYVRDITGGDFPAGPFDVVYHFAASYNDRDNWERDARTNVTGTIATLRAAHRWNARFIYAQTSLCYGLAPASPVKVSAPLDPHGSYAISKTAGESYIRDSGLDWVSLRLANIYGPRNLSGPAPAFYKRLAAGQPCTVVDSRRDFVHVWDLVTVAVRALTQGSGIYHVASGSDVAISDIYRSVRHAMGLDPEEPTVVPRGPDDAATLLLCPSRTERTFGWRASIPIGPGIATAVRWYREHGVSETYTHLEMKG